MNLKKVILSLLIIIFIIVNIHICYAIDLTSNDTNSDELSIYSESAILIDSQTGMILYSKDSDKKMYPASTTKILTSIIAIEQCNLSEIITIKSSVFSSIPSGYSSANLLDGEEISIEDLLILFLVHSANDAGYILADHISGSIDDFADLMNSKAEEIGCTNSHFTNPSGVHNENHYSTAYDLSLIAKYCMNNQTFRNIVSLPYCNISATNKSDVRYFSNTNDLLNSSSKYYLEGCNGIKTGYTSEAKNCLISSCIKNDVELICVVLGAGTTETGGSERYIDTHTIFNYGFSTYNIKNIIKANSVITNINISNGTKDSRNLNLVTSEDLNILLNKNFDINSISPQINLNTKLSAPISKGDQLGTIDYSINGEFYSIPLIASHSVEKDDNMILIIQISLLSLIIVIVLCFIFIKLNEHRKKKLKYSRNY